MTLFSERLPSLSAKTRQDVVPVIIKLIGVIRDLLKSQTDKTMTLSAFGALKAIGITSCSGEESPLMETIPSILVAIKGRTLAPSAMAALSTLPCASPSHSYEFEYLIQSFRAKLGPRLIPHFREMISQSVAIIGEGTLGTTSNQ